MIDFIRHIPFFCPFALDINLIPYWKKKKNELHEHFTKMDENMKAQDSDWK